MAVGVPQLGYFVAIAEHGTLTRAAAALHLSQPSLTTQLHRLERDLGVELFERLPRGVRLTPAGSALLPVARQALADVEQVRRLANELASPEGGTLRVGGTPSLSGALLPSALSAFHQTHPRVALEFAEAGSEELVALLERDAIDLALVTLPVPHHGVRTVPVADEDVVLAVGPGHRLAARKAIGVSDLADIPLVVPRQGYSVRTTVFSACRRAGFEPVVACDGGEMSGVLALVARGLGAAVIPGIVATHHPDLHTIRIDSPQFVRTIGLARRAGAIGPPAADAFAAGLLRLLGEAGWPGLRPVGSHRATPAGGHPR